MTQLHRKIGALGRKTWVIRRAKAATLGPNEHFAWGLINTGPDVQDLYIERIDPANPAQYQTPQGWQGFDSGQEIIPVKGQKPVSCTWRATRHGH